MCNLIVSWCVVCVVGWCWLVSLNDIAVQDAAPRGELSAGMLRLNNGGWWQVASVMLADVQGAIAHFNV